MHFSPTKALADNLFASRSLHCTWLAESTFVRLGIFSLALWSAPLLAQVGETPTSDLTAPNIFPVAPRELRQSLNRAQTAIAEQRYSDAATYLGEILNSPTTDDYFLGRPGSPDAQQSLKSAALNLIGSMPAQGRQIYETTFGFEGRAELDKALDAGSLQGLTEVARRYFHTKAGYEATLLLGRAQLDQGRPLSAAMTLKRIADTPSAAAQYDPELSVLLATCWMHARMPEQAQQTLVALKKRQPQATIRLLEGTQPLFARDDEALAWLEKLVGGSRSPLALAASQWALYRGNAMRNAASDGGAPLLNFRWSLPTVNDPHDEQKVRALARVQRDRLQPTIPALQPLVVHDTVVIRAPDSNKLIGVNLKNGKRTWVFPPFDESPSTSANRSSAAGGPAFNMRDQELQQRVWEDNTFGQIASDGQQLYVIDELGYASPNTALRNNVMIINGRVVRTGWSKPNNMLVALDLKKQGYQVWAVGGTAGDNPNLDGAFFLGPPLPVGDLLYVLAEINTELRLLCLSAKTGQIEWKQNLAVVEDGQQIMVDAVRRMAGASPSMADGVLVCPTSAGAVVAIDLATRSLRWGYQYPRWDVTRRQIGAIGIRTTFSMNSQAQGKWLDATATIAEGAVILTPVESQELHCLDLLTGEAKWAAQPRDEMLYVACVREGQIVLVGNNKLKAISLADGKTTWTLPLEAGHEPTGRGFLSEDHYYLPLAGEQLAKIDIGEGKIVSQAKTEAPLGNVICYQDQLISQSSANVAAYYLAEPLAARVAEALAKNPDDPEALALQGQILLQEGKREESLAVLRRAAANRPDDLKARALLVKVMLSLVRDDFAANFHLAEELEQLVTDPTIRREILRYKALGLSKAGKHQEAFAALLALADQWDPALFDAEAAGSDTLESIGREVRVRQDRWLQGQLKQMLEAADAAVRETMIEPITGRLEQALATGGPTELRAFLRLYGFHPRADEARLALAEKLVGGEQFLEAELLVGSIAASPEPQLAGRAVAILAVAYGKASRYALAARCYARLADEFASIDCFGGKTGREIAAAAAQEKNLDGYRAGSWPVGLARIKIEEGGDGTAQGVIASQRMRYPVSLSHRSGAPLPGLTAAFDPTQAQIVVRDDSGNQIALASLRGTNGVYQRLISVPSNQHVGSHHGHLVVVNMGDQVVAVDTLRASGGSGDNLLWKLDAVDVDPTSRTYPQQRVSSNPFGGTRTRLYDASGRVSFYVAPVLQAGFCFQKGSLILCADPLTGQILWERSQAPASAEIFGDEELIFVTDPNQDEALVLSAIDGQLLGKRKVDRGDRRWTTVGRNVLAWEQVGRDVKLRLFDAWSQIELWSATYPLGTRGTIVEGEDLALLEPSGKLTVSSLRDGRTLFASPLAPEGSLASIEVLRSRSQYLVIANQEITSNESPSGYMIRPVGVRPSGPSDRIHGRVYAFDRRTGKVQWQIPAFVAFHCLPPDQPLESPLLVFVRNKVKATPGSATRSSGSVMCLDRRDGRLVWDSENEPVNQQFAQAINYCDIQSDPVRKSVRMYIQSPPLAKTITIELTDQPQPPEPPAQTGEMASNRVGQLPGIVDASIDAALDLLKQGIRPGGLVPGVRPAIPARARAVRPAAPPVPAPPARDPFGNP
ncbi:MAG: PQQ-binding-like beta-propeller repeat protein [Pirellulaceae bacterium]|jgi:outer membrane protein assembly factor BamB|nr:PQQ-binding-like beta-propeller repeat protein [Pirellulaceae bacterium]